jgi:hypothetical protein
MEKQKQEEYKRKKQEMKKNKELLIVEMIQKIDTLSQQYNSPLFETAVGRWKLGKQQKRSAEKEIKEAEAKLNEVKRKFGVK